MKSYLVTTGLIFGLMSAVHVWRAVEEWPAAGISLGFVLGMGTLIALPGILAWWAWCVLRNLPRNQDKRGAENNHGQL
jgi:hypothetical protein